jgi:1,4-alpha-glucan branching enzyme
MPLSQQNISGDTPMGASLISGGATFRVWAPNALAVYVTGDFNNGLPEDANLLNQMDGGHWGGFIPAVSDRQKYLFYVKGKGGDGPKRDPYARELTTPFPGQCIIRDPAFPWHETGYETPAFSDFVIYQLHVGVFYAPNLPNKGTFLDVVSKIPYLKDLGITVLQLLPIQEYDTQFSMGYNNVDFYSPEMDYGVAAAALPPYLAMANGLLTAKGLAPYTPADLQGEMNQLKALVDICHAYGLGVIFDQVYNHGGGDFGDQSLFFMDRQTTETNWNSLYFTDTGYVGGLIFDYTKPEVRDFLIGNARFFLKEYRVDGFRYDEVSTIDNDGHPYGWNFCQDLTNTVRFIDPSKINHAEYWPTQALTVTSPPAGIGFDTTLSDSLRIAIRDVIGGASWPGDGPLNMSGLASALWTGGFNEPWQFVTGPEDHDVVYMDNNDKVPRIPALSDPSNSRSWYATSRSRVSTGILLTAPGVPMFFMGQEFLEDKYWTDNFEKYPGLFIYWDGLDKQKQMADFLRYTRELIALRWHYPALRSNGFAPIHIDNQNRVLAFHRWVPGEGGDVVIIIHLGNSNVYGYRVGFPSAGAWTEIFNSDVYEHWVNPNICGNGGQVNAENWPYDNLSCSASVVLPANSVLLFSKTN